MARVLLIAEALTAVVTVAAVIAIGGSLLGGLIFAVVILLGLGALFVALTLAVSAGLSETEPIRAMPSSRGAVVVMAVCTGLALGGAAIGAVLIAAPHRCESGEAWTCLFPTSGVYVAPAVAIAGSAVTWLLLVRRH